MGVVVNPVAGSGRMRRRWPGIEQVLTRQLGPLDVKKTSGPGEACDLARQLSMDGAELVIAAGGDGTVSETVDGLLQARTASGQRADLAIVPVGTGSDSGARPRPCRRHRQARGAHRRRRQAHDRRRLRQLCRR